MSRSLDEGPEALERVGALLDADPRALSQELKSTSLCQIMSDLTLLHWERCAPYQRVLKAQGFSPPFQFGNLREVPALPVSLFKSNQLLSVPPDRVVRVLRSSGTTTQTPSLVYLDAATAQLQTRALVRIMQRVIGVARLPMLIIDAPSTTRDRTRMTARAAGILGLSSFGRDHTYALDDSMQLDWQAVDGFMQRHAEAPVLLFGFTFMVWQYFVRELERTHRSLHLPNGILIHSGGWKKLQAEAVDGHVFKARLAASTAIGRVHDFYGMVEQVGSVFVECAAGFLHAPPFADVLVRDIRTWDEVPIGDPGVLQVVSALPRSYPGHSLLTEDVGQVVHEDTCPCGQLGRAFTVSGRVPRAEVRGCSDTHETRR